MRFQQENNSLRGCVVILPEIGPGGLGRRATTGTSGKPGFSRLVPVVPVGPVENGMVRAHARRSARVTTSAPASGSTARRSSSSVASTMKAP